MDKRDFSIGEIAQALGADTFGDPAISVSGVAEPQEATASDLAMATTARYAEDLSAGNARAAVLWEGADWQALGLDAAIVPRRPRFAMAGLTQLLDQGQGFSDEIHPSAIIDPTAEIGENVRIGALTVIGPGAHVGRGQYHRSSMLHWLERSPGTACIFA